jgi:hypothetical protein
LAPGFSGLDYYKGGSMRRITTLALTLVAVLAVSALAAGTAAAKTKKLVIYSAEPELLAAPGDNFDMVLYHWSTSENVGPNTFQVETSTGTASCTGTEFPFTGLQGKVETNSESTDKVEMTETFGTMGGSAACPNTSPLGTSAAVYLLPNASILNLSGSKGKAELKAKSTSQPLDLDVFYSGGAACGYTATALKGTLKLQPYSSWEQMVVTFTKAKVKLAKGSESVCSKKTTISGSFGYQNRGGEGFGEGLFLFGKLV